MGNFRAVSKLTEYKYFNYNTCTFYKIPTKINHSTYIKELQLSNSKQFIYLAVI